MSGISRRSLLCGLPLVFTGSAFITTEEAFSGEYVFDQPLGSRLPYISRIKILPPEETRSPYPYPGVLTVDCTFWSDNCRVVSSWDHLFSHEHTKHTESGLKGYMAVKEHFAKQLAELSYTKMRYKHPFNPVELILYSTTYYAA